MSRQQIILSCYSDLCKAATSFYLNPKGTTQLMFIRHAKELLKKSPEYSFHKFIVQLEQIEKEVERSDSSGKDLPYTADKIHTLGTLIKYS